MVGLNFSDFIIEKEKDDLVLVGICSMYRAAKFVDNLLDPLSDSFPFHVISDYFQFSSSDEVVFPSW